MEPFQFENIPEVLRLLFEKVEQLEILIRNSVPKIDENTTPMSIEEAAEFLKMTAPALYSKVSRKEIPVNKPGKKLYFYKGELNEWVRSGKQKTITEINADSKSHSKKLKKPFKYQ
jgi:excisionase family DNA binding protein